MEYDRQRGIKRELSHRIAADKLTRGLAAFQFASIEVVLDSVVRRVFVFFFSSRRRHTRFDCDWSSDVCSSDLVAEEPGAIAGLFPAVSRRCGRAPWSVGWTVDDAARVALLTALPLRGKELVEDRKSVV